MLYAQCNGCGATGTRAEVSTDITDNGEAFDQCRECGGVDVDVLSIEGLVHEANKEAT